MGWMAIWWSLTPYRGIFVLDICCLSSYFGIAHYNQDGSDVMEQVNSITKSSLVDCGSGGRHLIPPHCTPT